MNLFWTSDAFLTKAPAPVPTVASAPPTATAVDFALLAQFLRFWLFSFTMSILEPAALKKLPSLVDPNEPAAFWASLNAFAVLCNCSVCWPIALLDSPIRSVRPCSFPCASTRSAFSFSVSWPFARFFAVSLETVADCVWYSAVSFSWCSLACPSTKLSALYCLLSPLTLCCSPSTWVRLAA